MNILPHVRANDIVVQQLKGEVLVYDLKTNRAFCLNETSSAVFKACGDQSSFDDLKRRHKFTDEIIFLALDELKKKNLLAEDAEFVSPFAGMSRREAIRKVGLASMIALPIISSLVAPTAAMAQSVAACAGNQPTGTVISCANNSNDCGTNANAATCRTCTTVFVNNTSGTACGFNGFTAKCVCS